MDRARLQLEPSNINQANKVTANKEDQPRDGRATSTLTYNQSEPADTTTRLRQVCVFFFSVTISGRVQRVANGCTRSRVAAKTATAAFDAAARTSDRGNSFCRVSAPQRTAPEDGKDQGVGERAVPHGDFPEDPHSPAGALRAPAVPGHPDWVSRGATGGGSAARRGACG